MPWFTFRDTAQPQEALVDNRNLSRAEMIIGISGIVMLIASFLPWFSVDIGVASADANGWDLDFFWGPLPVLIGILLVAYVAITKFASGVNLPDAPWGMIVMVAGIIAGALVVLKLIIGEDGAFGIEVERSFGLFLAALAGIGLAVGGFFYNQERNAGTTTGL